jgi:hypothetical protein
MLIFSLALCHAGSELVIEAEPLFKRALAIDLAPVGGDTPINEKLTNK